MLRNLPPIKLALYGGILLGFIMLESPAVMMANQIEPMLLGMPFLFVWNLAWWGFITLLFLVAYLTDWGSRTTTNDSAR
ncbi:hypothetical protein [Halomonas sp. A29]|uniref:hypothetical protein n=1 Tax=Halomonas sp. A29 TaxID=3102786 RepID=UPI00398B8CC3